MKPYHVISGSIFGLVAIAHLLRLINQWPLVLGPYAVPLPISWAGLIITGCLSFWSFRLIRTAR